MSEPICTGDADGNTRVIVGHTAGYGVSRARGDKEVSEREAFCQRIRPCGAADPNSAPPPPACSTMGAEPFPKVHRSLIVPVIVVALAGAACTSAENKARAYIASGDRYVEKKQYAEAAL